RINHIQIAGRQGQPDSAQVFRGQAGFDLVPRLAAICGAVNGAFRPAVDQRPDVPPSLIRRSQEDVGIARVQGDIGDAGVFADVEDEVPGLAAVGRLVKAAVTSWAPKRSLGGDVDRVRIAGIDQDLPDVFRVFEADVFPRLAAVGGFVDAVAVSNAALAVVLPGATQITFGFFGSRVT